MNIPIKVMNLHNPLFLGGTNFKTALNIEDKKDLQLFYQEKKNRYVVIFNGMGKFVHESNVASAEPVDFKDLGLDFTPEKVNPIKPAQMTNHPVLANVSNRAQASDPTRGMK